MIYKVQGSKEAESIPILLLSNVQPYNFIALKSGFMYNE
jgi:hypothetical protein